MNEKSPHWHDFLKKVYTLLSSYEIQKDRSLYNVANLDDWGKKDKPQNTNVWFDMPKLFSILQTYNINIDHVNTTEVTESNWARSQLHHIIKQTLHRKFGTHLCFNNGTRIEVRENLVKLSDISVNLCKTRLKTLEIFASDTVFIDADFTSTDPDFTLIIMAPKWEMIGTRTINLDGEDAASLDVLKASPGQPGRPGLPGKPGGSFFGLSQTIINGKNLTITSNGGRGGSGEDGGDGLDGQNGVHATTSTYEYFIREKIAFARWRIFGEVGHKGGTGGSGGKGGFGGNPGYVKIFEIGDRNFVNVETAKGDNGNGGKGGKGGVGGKSGNNVEATFIICCWSGEEEIENKQRGAEGDRGLDGDNDIGRIKAEDSKLGDYRNTISEFKVYLRNSLKGSQFKKRDITRFLTQLDLNSDVINYFSFEGIIKDYEKLEQQFRGYWDVYFEFPPFYQNFLEVVARQATALDSNRHDERIILNHLYTSLLTKLNIFKENKADTSLYIKIESFLDLQVDRYRSLIRYGANDVLQPQYTGDRNGIPNLIESTVTFIQDAKNELTTQLKHRIPVDDVVKRFNHTVDNLNNNILITVGNVSESFGNIGLNIKKILSDNNHVSNFLYLGDLPKIKVPAKEISAIKTVIEALQMTEPEIIDEFKNLGAEAEIDQLKSYGSSIRDAIDDLVKNIKEDVDRFEEELKSGVLSRLNVTKWEVSKVLKLVKYYVKQLPKTSSSNTLEGLNHMIDIYQRLESYYQQKEMFDYTNVLYDTDWAPKIKNGSLSKLAATLKETSILNLIAAKLEKDFDTLKQYTFPYGGEFLSKYKLKYSILMETNTTAVLYRCIDSLESVKNAIFYGFRDVDQYIFSINDYDYRRPFFTWIQEDYRFLFKKIFAGEEVLLKANAKSDQRNGVHFKWIEMYFKARNETNQEKVTEALKGVTVTLTHSGNSYYRCDNKTYLVTTAPCELFYGATKRNNSEKPYDRNSGYNGVYKKIHTGDPILSPFTTWKLQLSTKHGFGRLKTLVNMVDLQLVGSGMYIQHYPGGCEGKIDEFYEVDEPFPLPEIGKGGRNKRATRNGDFSPYYTSGAARISSPFNGLFSWISPTFLSSVARMNYLGTFATKSAAESPKSYLNPLPFFDRVNSVLVLVPILLYLGRSCFYHCSTCSNGKKQGRIPVSKLRSCREFIAMFRRILLKYDLGVEWLWAALESREEEIESVDNKEKGDAFEACLVVLFVDFLEDVQYDSQFVKVKFDGSFIRDVDRLFEMAERIPGFLDKLKSL